MSEDASEREHRGAIKYWWDHANTGTRRSVRAAGYYADTPLPPSVVATFASAGVVLIDAHRVPPEGGGPRGYYLTSRDSHTLRLLDGAGQE